MIGKRLSLIELDCTHKAQLLSVFEDFRAAGQERFMADWEQAQGDIVANGLKFHYHRTGGDKPPLVIAHAVTDNGITWARVARALQADYDVVMYDRRGHGLSDAPERGYAFDDHAADLASLIAALGLERPRLIGHSGGAAAVTIFAADHPDLPACAILKDPPWSNGWGGWAAG